MLSQVAYLYLCEGLDFLLGLPIPIADYRYSEWDGGSKSTTS